MASLVENNDPSMFVKSVGVGVLIVGARRSLDYHMACNNFACITVSYGGDGESCILQARIGCQSATIIVMKLIYMLLCCRGFIKPPKLNRK